MNIQVPTPLQFRDLSNGIVQKVDDKLAPKNCVNFSFNMRYDKTLGRASIREGTALVGTQIVDAKSILGLHQFILSAGTKYQLAVINGASASQIYRLESGTWTTTGADGVMTKDVYTRFLTYLDTVMALDGTLAKSSTDGTAWVATAGNLDIGNCPKGKFAIEWRDRVYVAGVSSALDRLYYSSIPTSGAISWTAGNGYIDVEPYEGQGAITGLAKVPGYLLIFKERSLKRWNGSSTFPDDLTKIGSSSQESIVLGSSTVFYFSASGKSSLGFYETNGETVRKISRPIQSIIEAISSSNYSTIAGFSDGEIVMWSVGDITYDGISYSNVVLLYHIESQTWAVLGFPTKFVFFQNYIDGTTLKIIGGNNDGEVIEIFTGTTDNYTDNSSLSINYALQYHPNDFGMRGNMKEISSIVPYTKKGKDSQLSIRVDEAGSFNKYGCVIDDFETEITESSKGHIFELRFDGSTKSGSLEIIGLDIISPEINATINK